MKSIPKIKLVRYMITILHMIATLVWQGKIFKNVGVNPSGTKLLNDAIPDMVERIVTLSLSFLFAFLIIWFLWKAVFAVFEDFKREYILFFVIYIAGAVFLAALWPQILTYVGASYDDNVVTYSCAVRLTPDYWHSIYHSVIYCAALLVFPVDFMIPLCQWTLYVLTMVYVFERAKALEFKRKWLIFLVFALPDNLLMMGYSHRIMIYVSLATLYAAIIIFDILERRERSFGWDVCLALFGAFLCVYRSEGIIPGMLLYGIYVLFQGRRKIGPILGSIGLFAVFFLLITLPQKMGSIRYYGDDYSMLNAMAPLQVIINAPESRITAEQWDGINGVLPSWAIAQYGADGYRRYNSTVTGNPDLDQSSAGDRSKAFMKAYTGVILANKEIYLNYLLDKFFVTTASRHLYFFEQYYGEDHGLPGWTYPGWDNGREDLFGNHHTLVWTEYTQKLGIFPKVKEISDKWTAICRTYFLYLGWLTLLVLGNLVLFVTGMVKTIVHKEKAYIGLGFAALSTIVLFIATAAVMPEAWTMYLTLSARLMELTLLFGWGMHVVPKREFKTRY